MKKLNTIAYYNLPNNALLTMQSRGTQSFTFRSKSLKKLILYFLGGSSDTTCSVWSSTQLIESTHSPVNNHNNTTRSSGSGFDDTQYYHLSPPVNGSGSHNNSRSYSLIGRNKSLSINDTVKTKRRRRKSLPTNNKSSLQDPFCIDKTTNSNTRTVPEIFLTRLLMW